MHKSIIKLMQVHPSDRPHSTLPLEEIRSILEGPLESFKGESKASLITELIDTLQKYNVMNYISHLNASSRMNKETPLDLGAKPAVISKETANDFLPNKVFLTPDSTDTTVIAEYGDFVSGFEIKGNNAFEKFGKHGINAEELLQTLRNAEKLLEPTKGRVVKSEVILLLLIVLGGIIFGGLSLSLALKSFYIIAFAIISSYVLALGLYNLYLGRKNSKLLVYAHLALALFVRSENNRIYLKHKINLRPGYLAKWLEFNFATVK